MTDKSALATLGGGQRVLMAKRIGFLGLGKMGAAIAARLEARDVELHIHDPALLNTALFVARGATAHADARAVADICPIVFACLPGPEVSRQTAVQVAEGSAIGLYVELSTIGREAIQDIAAALAGRDIALVDAPVSGGPAAAREGRLTVMAAASDVALAEVRPLLERIAGTLCVVGDRPGLGQAMKLANNLLAAVNFAAACETMVMGTTAGLSPETMIDVMNQSSGRNSATEWLIPNHVLTERFDFGASIATMLKDVMLGLGEADGLDVAMPVSTAVAGLWRAAAEIIGGDADITRLAQMDNHALRANNDR